MDRIKKFFKSTAGMVLIVTILVGIIVHATTGNFFTAYNISTLTRAASFVIIVGFGPVSYTHLDVYKRQIYGKSGYRRTLSCKGDQSFIT